MVEPIFVPWWSDSDRSGAPQAHIALSMAAHLPPWSRADVPVAATTPDPMSRGLADFHEEELVSLLLWSAPIRIAILGPLVNSQHFWLAVGLQPGDLPHRKWRGKPGDIDFLLGPMRRDEPDFSRIIGVELKLIKAKPGRSPSPSSLGTTQSAELFNVGCNLGALVQIVVGHQSLNRDTAAWAAGTVGTLFGMDLSSAGNSIAHLTERHRESRVGYLLGLWGHPAQNEPLARSALTVFPLLRPLRHKEELHVEWQIANDQLRRSLMEIWCDKKPADHIVRRCPKGGHVVPVARAEQERCPECNKPWMKSPRVPTPENVQSLGTKGKDSSD